MPQKNRKLDNKKEEEEKKAYPNWTCD
jgi:hypothetical protein